jgi:hypothetical protein
MIRGTASALMMLTGEWLRAGLNLGRLRQRKPDCRCEMRDNAQPNEKVP